ncbi:MerR family transcriptional regulator [Frankia sp. CNm7]|uniref:MerR family transcriptional regulator n=1 Tax=Frankia nepalensis TaxID=1836974 RepID=A0A937RLI6_9ACTN|nr:MerR family transcriptional regulator [Frankia nepalensis]MBL7497585.1 MerR family transcriptional regulator [Frankia nepalensis]MBL7509602.1 MerR family transcriptional regulator [Frankia nepalensis]MBL7517089.1 MerR family transcriptional regulator [Frankia nepalensis]MBL7631039.1 MerR family transcriptional regulator [Frankia nepalensis]
MNNRRNRVEDLTYPAFSMGAAADLLDVEPAFLRALGHEGLLSPHRSSGGHRRYSRADLDLAARAREIVDEGLTVAAACRIALLEQQLAQTRAELAELQRHGARHRARDSSGDARED